MTAGVRNFDRLRGQIDHEPSGTVINKLAVPMSVKKSDGRRRFPSSHGFCAISHAWCAAYPSLSRTPSAGILTCRGRDVDCSAPPSRPGELHPEALTEPCMIVS